MLWLLIALVAILAIVALIVFIVSRVREHGDAAGGAPTPEAPGTYYGEAPATSRHPTRDYIGEEAQDLTPDPQAETELWKEERERYREKNEPS
jgi:hypothetical protein